MAFKRKSRTATRPRTRKAAPYAKRPMRTLDDGQNLLVSAFCEVHAQTATATETEMSYSICLDPKALTLTAGQATTTFADGGADDGALIGSGDDLNIPKWNTFSQLFNQYRINSVSCSVRGSISSIEFPINMSNDIGDGTPCGSQLQATSGAHKTFYITEANREAKYQVKNTGNQLDYLSTASGQAQVSADKRYIKIHQHLPKTPAPQIVAHGVQLYISLTMKDSKSLN